MFPHIPKYAIRVCVLSKKNILQLEKKIQNEILHIHKLKTKAKYLTKYSHKKMAIENKKKQTH